MDFTNYRFLWAELNPSFLEHKYFPTPPIGQNAMLNFVLCGII
jgi:hypothetical protein